MLVSDPNFPVRSLNSAPIALNASLNAEPTPDILVLKASTYFIIVSMPEDSFSAIALPSIWSNESASLLTALIP